MTLIVTVITPTFVMQASDRRVTHVKHHRRNGKRWREITDPDDRKNKAIVYESRMSVAFTGVAGISGERTDLWIAKRLSEAEVLTEGTEHLRLSLTRKFHQYALLGRKHAVLFAGWSYQRDSVQAIYIIVSNYIDENGESGKARLDFKTTYYFAPENSFGIFTAGARVDAEKLSDARSVVGRILASGTSTENIAKYLLGFIRRVSSDDATVGESVLITSIPRSSVRNPPDGYSFVVTGPTDDIASFLYYPKGVDDGIIHGPIMVTPHQVASDFRSGTFGDDGQFVEVTLH